jgi:hypothetical protein
MESVETINQRLIDYYGLDVASDRPIFRIVWANEQLEKRRVDVTEAGIELLFPEVVEIKKYSYLKDLYVLERLVVVPEEYQRELGVKTSYEPLWAFADENRNPLPPLWSAAKFIIDTMYAALGKSNMAKYVEDEKQTTPEGREQRITELQEELFGNETEVGDALRYREGIVVPPNYKVN